jgi:hypothetical protein
MAVIKPPARALRINYRKENNPSGRYRQSGGKEGSPCHPVGKMTDIIAALQGAVKVVSV